MSLFIVPITHYYFCLRIIQDLHNLFLELLRAESDKFVFTLFTDFFWGNPFRFIGIKTVMIIYSFYGTVLIKDIFITKPVTGNTDFANFLFHDLCFKA